MNKKVLVISTSLRPRSNSEALADAFARGASDAGHEVESVSLRSKNIAFCKGCLACQKTLRCVIADDAPAIVGKMGRAMPFRGADISLIMGNLLENAVEGAGKAEGRKYIRLKMK